MPFSTIATPDAKPVANYKMATRMEGGRLLYISGQVAWDASGAIVGKGDARAQARQVLQNMRGVLQAAGGDLSNLMKITTYITKIEDRPLVAEACNEVFSGELPASTLGERRRRSGRDRADVAPGTARRRGELSEPGRRGGPRQAGRDSHRPQQRAALDATEDRAEGEGARRALPRGARERRRQWRARGHARHHGRRRRGAAGARAARAARDGAEHLPRGTRGRGEHHQGH